MSDLVTAIIPSFNRAHCIARAVDSALNQTHSPVEVVVVDDGSTDGTGDLMSRVYGSNARVRYVRQQNRGVSAARNVAIGLARGDYIAFLDSDDTWEPWKLQLQLGCLRSLPH